MLFSEVGQRTGGSRSGMPKNCVVAAYITFISLLFPSPTYNYFWFAAAILNLQVQEVYDMADVGTTDKTANENHWNFVCSWHRT